MDNNTRTLSNSVIMPREDFIELSEAAWNQPTPSAGERVAGTLQTTVVCAALAGMVAGASWGWATAAEWLEEKRFQRELRRKESEKSATQ